MNANDGIAPIKRETLATAVAERLRELIVAGTYEPGEQLSEVDLAEQFAVSRGPVREGLQLLVQEGLLRREPHRGVFVPLVTDEDIVDVYLAREAIETSALRLILRDHPDPADRARMTAPLHKTLKDMRSAAAAGRWGRVADLDMVFHREVVASAGSPRLARMYATLVAETRALFNMTAAVSERASLVDEHAEIIDLLDSGDADELLERLSRHFRESIATLRRYRSSRAAAVVSGAPA